MFGVVREWFWLFVSVVATYYCSWLPGFESVLAGFALISMYLALKARPNI